jgi:hypothetical protein
MGYSLSIFAIGIGWIGLFSPLHESCKGPFTLQLVNVFVSIIANLSGKIFLPLIIRSINRNLRIPGGAAGSLIDYLIIYYNIIINIDLSLPA